MKNKEHQASKPSTHMATLCNNMYRDLLARLGELAIQRQALDKSIKIIEAQLELLNAISPELQALELKAMQPKTIQDLGLEAGVGHA